MLIFAGMEFTLSRKENLLLLNPLDVCMAAGVARTNVQKVPLIMLAAEKVDVMGQVIAVNWRRIMKRTTRDGSPWSFLFYIIIVTLWIRRGEIGGGLSL